MEKYVAAILREAACRQVLLTEPVETVYVGGGTPSLLPPAMTEHLLSGLKKQIGFDHVFEFTVEANPGTVSPEWLDVLRCHGVNRISFGVQAVQDALLKTLGRIHRFDDVKKTMNEARSAGFSNINLDLIFGIPGQKADDWIQTIHEILALSPEHISAYGLIPEEGTPLFRDLANGKISLPDVDIERDMYDAAISAFQNAGYHQYEISNFAKPGFECRNNIGYWNQISYLGLGLSAASMLKCAPDDINRFSVRWTNPESFNEYYDTIGNRDSFEKRKENISQSEARFETVMLSLRMTSGMRRSRFRDLHGHVPEYWYGDVLKRLRDQGMMELHNDSWRLTRRGMDIQNSILLEFMDL